MPWNKGESRDLSIGKKLVERLRSIRAGATEKLEQLLEKRFGRAKEYQRAITF